MLAPSIIYILCCLASGLCAIMLGRSWHRTRVSLLFWSAASFLLFAAANLLLVVDLIITGPDVNLQLPRMILNLAGVSVLLFGFIWSGEE